MDKSCCFIGPCQLRWNLNEYTILSIEFMHLLHWQIKKTITKLGIRNYICGVDKEIDFLVAETILDFKRIYPITIECVITSEIQAAHWPKNDQERYFSILRQADRRTIIRSHFMEDRCRNCNRYLIDHCECLYAVWDGANDEIRNTIDYARLKGRQIHIIDPVYLLIVPDWV